MMELPEKQPLLSFSHYLRSRYAETDKMGYVYYGIYLEYFEEARTEMIRSMGINYADLESRGVMLPVIHAELSYRSPVFYDEKMCIEVLIYERPTVKLRTFYQVWTDRSDSAHIIGQVDLAFVDAENRKPVRAPDYFIKAFNRL